MCSWPTTLRSRVVGSWALVNAGGQAVVSAARLLGQPLAERLADADLFPILLALAEGRGYSASFLDATRDVTEEAARRLHRRHSRLDVAGAHDGFFAETEEAVLCAEIARLRPLLLFVGIPSPRKEYWLAANLERLGVTVAVTIGGSFDVLAGLTRCCGCNARAPSTSTALPRSRAVCGVATSSATRGSWRSSPTSCFAARSRGGQQITV